MAIAILLAACSGGAPPDMSALKDPGSKNAFIILTAELKDATCQKKSVIIGRKIEGGYKRVAEIAIGAAWASATGVQTSLPAGQYHIVGMPCFGARVDLYPGRVQAGALPYDPTYFDSLGSFELAPSEIVSLGDVSLTLEQDGRFAVKAQPLDTQTLERAKQTQPELTGRIAMQTLKTSSAPVEGRCFLARAQVPCPMLKKLSGT